MRRLLLSLALLASLPLLAAELYFDGRLVSTDGPLPSTTVSLTPRLYSAGEGGEVRKSFDKQDVVSDAAGYFSFHLPETDLSAYPGPLWLGARLDDGQEVMPRRKIVDSPYAIHTRSAVLVQSKNITMDDTLTTADLEATKADVSGETLLKGELTLRASLGGFSDLYLGDLRLGPSATLEAMRPVFRSGEMTQKYGQFQKEGKEIVIEKNDSDHDDLVAEQDGFLVVIAKSDHSGGQSKFRFSLKVGEIDYFRDRELNTDDDPKGLVFTVPVRRGEKVTIRGRCEKSGLYWRRGWIKHRFIYFGAQR